MGRGLDAGADGLAAAAGCCWACYRWVVKFWLAWWLGCLPTCACVVPWLLSAPAVGCWRESGLWHLWLIELAERGEIPFHIERVNSHQAVLCKEREK